MGQFQNVLFHTFGQNLGEATGVTLTAVTAGTAPQHRQRKQQTRCRHAAETSVQNLKTSTHNCASPHAHSLLLRNQEHDTRQQRDLKARIFVFCHLVLSRKDHKKTEGVRGSHALLLTAVQNNPHSPKAVAEQTHTQAEDSTTLQGTAQLCSKEQDTFPLLGEDIKYQAKNCICVLRLESRWNGTV